MNDTTQISLKVKGTIASVCQVKGCWMDVKLSDEKSMKVMFKDIQPDLRSRRQREPLDDVLFSEILYADDTFIFGRYMPNINKLLWKIICENCFFF